jgi:hypothetical protein
VQACGSNLPSILPSEVCQELGRSDILVPVCLASALTIVCGSGPVPTGIIILGTWWLGSSMVKRIVVTGASQCQSAASSSSRGVAAAIGGARNDDVQISRSADYCADERIFFALARGCC